MARAAKINVKGGLYHVMNRGLDGMTVFHEARENEHFLEHPSTEWGWERAARQGFMATAMTMWAT